MTTILPTVAVLVIFSIVIMMLLLCPSSEKRDKETNETSNDEAIKNPIEKPTSESNTAFFRIAGISHHCSRYNIGLISGQTINDPGNKYDKKAVMIMDANKNCLLGYISKDDQTKYRKIAGSNERLPFIGYIEQFINDDCRQTLFGIIKVYQGDEDIVIDDINKDWDYLNYAIKIKSYEDRIKALDKFRY